MTTDEHETLEEALGALGRRGETNHPADETRPRLRTTPALAALQKAGTRHLYADTADADELAGLLVRGDGSIAAEVDGNTANQPLVEKVTERYLAGGAPQRWAARLTELRPGFSRRQLLGLLYAVLCARVGNDMRRRFGAGREWEASLQLHMGLCGHRAEAVEVGRLLARAAPGALVKVPFTPDSPGCLLVARDLERAGIRVNLTSTFSARQVAVAALLAGATRTNIFMGRLDQGLQADLLGEHVDLEAQRLLHRLRREDGVPTQLIVASMRDWRTFVRVAGCDVFTAPCGVLRDFLAQDEVRPEAIESRLETSYEDDLGVPDEVVQKLGSGGIARLYRVEPELIEFLREERARPEAERPRDGEALYERFDAAGFGELFHFPDESARNELAHGKLPDLDGRLVARIPLDTHYTLLANGDFARHQQTIDERMEKQVQRGRR